MTSGLSGLHWRPVHPAMRSSKWCRQSWGCTPAPLVEFQPKQRMQQSSDKSTVSQGAGGMVPRIDAEHWRRRAQEIRVLADQMRYDGPRREMLRIAAECATLASRDERPKWRAATPDCSSWPAY